MQLDYNFFAILVPINISLIIFFVAYGMRKIYDIYQKNQCCGLYRGFHFDDCRYYKNPQAIINSKKENESTV